MCYNNDTKAKTVKNYYKNIKGDLDYGRRKIH
jgi:hypothetical protein